MKHIQSIEQFNEGIRSILGEFENWFHENKDGDILKDLYTEYKYEVEQYGVDEPLPYKKWAKTYFDTQKRLSHNMNWKQQLKNGNFS